MQSSYIFLALLIVVLAINNSGQAQDNFPRLSGPYIGQEPPGKIAEVFAPGVISTDSWENGLTFTPALNEAHYLSKNRNDSAYGERRGMDQKGSITKTGAAYYFS